MVIFPLPGWAAIVKTEGLVFVTIGMEIAARLRDEARETNERRVLVLTGEPDRTREALQKALEALDFDAPGIPYVGTESPDGWQSIRPNRIEQLLGTTQPAVVLDCHERCEPNVLGSVVGAVDGGGLVVLLTPPLDSWPAHRDEFDETLAIPGYDIAAVGSHFRTRLVETLTTHRGIAIVDADTNQLIRDGLTDPPPRVGERGLTIPTDTQFPRQAYERCLTQDQIETLSAFESLQDTGEALVIAANRGRGKSSVAGLAAASLACQGYDILVTAPRPQNVEALFDRVRELGDAFEEGSRETAPDSLTVETEAGKIEYFRPPQACEHVDSFDRVLVDEAAAIGVSQLTALLAAPSIAFTTTIHGYEGTGRGFAVRFRDHLTESEKVVTDKSMTTPIRYAPADPVEVWSFNALALDARPPVDPLVEDATPASVEYRELTPADLLANETLLKQVFGLLVLAHYRTEPNDLARVLDAPNVSVHGLFHDTYPVSVALVAREGNLEEPIRRQMYEGQRVRGHMIPDVLTGQLRDELAGVPTGDRILRITTHSAVRSRGLGSALVDAIRDRSDADWLGVGYGGTPQLVRFWRTNGFQTVHIGTSRNKRSGEHSLVMIDPLTQAGDELLDRHTEWFIRRLAGTLSDPLSDLDPDVVREATRSLDSQAALDLSTLEWKLLVGMPAGAGIFDTAPRPVRTLTLHHLTGDRTELLSPDAERLLVRKALQAQDWETVAKDGPYHGQSSCKRAMGAVIQTLVEQYGTRAAIDELTAMTTDDPDEN